MKIRYYRGPFDGKTAHVQLPAGRYDILVEVKSDKDLWSEYLDPSHAVKTLRARYVMTNCRHPDGSIFFEWDKPKGSRIK